MAPPTDSESGGTPRGEGRAPLRLADDASDEDLVQVSAKHTEEAHTASGDQSSSDLVEMIGALRARVDEEFRIMERLDAKARQAFALVAAFFAVVQAVAFGAFAQTEITNFERIALAVTAIVAGLSVGVVGYHLRSQEALRKEADLDPDQILGWLNAATRERDASRNLVVGLAEVAKERYANNRYREELYKTLDGWARGALILTSVELLVAIVIRI
jgi:hypothetical protein